MPIGIQIVQTHKPLRKEGLKRDGNQFHCQENHKKEVIVFKGYAQE